MADPSPRSEPDVAIPSDRAIGADRYISRVPRRAMKSRRVAVAAVGAFSILLAIAVVLPLTRPGWGLTIDWTSGPQRHVPRLFWGLDGAVTYGLHFLPVLAVGRLVGFATAQWLLIGLVFPIAAFGMARLAGGSTIRRLAAASLYCVNPYLWQRMATGEIAY